MNFTKKNLSHCFKKYKYSTTTDQLRYESFNWAPLQTKKRPGKRCCSVDFCATKWNESNFLGNHFDFTWRENVKHNF